MRTALPIVDVKDIAGQITLQDPINLKAGEVAQFRVGLVAHQKLSGAYNKTDHGSDKGPFLATLAEEKTGVIVDVADERSTGGMQRFCALSDDGVSGSVNADPVQKYILSVWLKDPKKAGKLVLGWGDGGTK